MKDLTKMDVYEFKAEVAGLLNRAPASLYVNGQDLIVNTANRARKWAQKSVDFVRLNRKVTATVDLTTGAALSSVVLAGTSTPATIKKIVSGYVNFSNGSFMPIEMTSRPLSLSRQDRRQSYDPRARLPVDSSRISYPVKPEFYRQNDTIFITPIDVQYWQGQSSFDVGLDVIVKDVDWTTTEYGFFQLGANPASYSPTELGPFVITYASGDPNLHAASIPRMGTYRGHPMFADAANGMYVHFTDQWLDVSGAQSRWLLSDRPDRQDYCWYSPQGVDGLFSTTGWLPVGFSTQPDTTFGLNNLLSVIGDTSAPFWLDEAQEWLLLYVVQFLQSQFIKDSTRWPVTQKMVETAWQSVVDWNTSIGDGEPTFDLD